MNKMNLGCGPDILDGFVNVDMISAPGVQYWDCRNEVPKKWKGTFDFVLVNHVLCTMNYGDVKLTLQGILEILKPGGRVEIIDVDILKAFHAYQQMRTDLFPVDGKTIDEQLVMHLSGYSTRHSLYTPIYLCQLLIEMGFTSAGNLGMSEYDLRPDESLVVEGVK